MRALLALAQMAGPALADVDTMLDEAILPGQATFAEAAAMLAAAADDDCTPPSVKPAWQAAADAWVRVAHLRLGPGEAAALTIAFWPDERGAGRRTLARMIADADPMGADPAKVAQISAAARGLTGLELMLHDPDFAYAPGSYACALVAALAADLAAQAEALRDGWHAFAPALRTAGSPENAEFLSEAEAARALFTQLDAALAFSIEQRLARPLGTFDRPRPLRAENWRSRRSLRNVMLSLEAAVAGAEALAGIPLPRTGAAAGAARATAARIADPGFQDVTDPQARLRLEVLQQRLAEVRAAMAAELGAALGVTAGFNALDGD